MGPAVLVALCVAGTACGRFGFRAVGDAGGSDGPVADGPSTDGPPADGPQSLSCVSLGATCGPSGTSSCCASELVPGGLFYRSQDEGSDGMFTDNSDPATVSDFQLDTYLVTVGRFRQFVTAGLGTQQDPPAIGAGARMLNQTAGQGGWDPSFNASLTANAAALQSGLMCNPATTWTDAPGANESLPINCLTWFEAFAFCVWDGGFLPTEAEWNYAAAGGSDQLPYPWSNPATDLTIDCSHANFMNTTYCVDPPNGYPNAVGAESPIGDGKWGHSDLAGNVWEWTLDWYVAPYPNPCDDCANLTPATDRSIRGGSYNDTATSLRTPVRHFTLPTDRNPNTGVRCARTP